MKKTIQRYEVAINIAFYAIVGFLLISDDKK